MRLHRKPAWRQSPSWRPRSSSCRYLTLFKKEPDFLVPPRCRCNHSNQYFTLVVAPEQPFCCTWKIYAASWVLLCFDEKGYGLGSREATHETAQAVYACAQETRHPCSIAVWTPLKILCSRIAIQWHLPFYRTTHTCSVWPGWCTNECIKVIHQLNINLFALTCTGNTWCDVTTWLDRNPNRNRNRHRKTALEEARTEGAAAVAQAVADADSSAKEAAVSQEVELALCTATQDLEGARRSLVEWEARVEKVERALAAKVKRNGYWAVLSGL